MAGTYPTSPSVGLLHAWASEVEKLEQLPSTEGREQDLSNFWLLTDGPLHVYACSHFILPRFYPRRWEGTYLPRYSLLGVPMGMLNA